MTFREAIEIIKVAKAEVEWEYPLDYQIAFDKAIEVLEKYDKSEKVFDTLKINVRPMIDDYDIDEFVEKAKNCPSEEAICYGCHDNCRKCESMAILSI